MKARSLVLALSFAVLATLNTYGQGAPYGIVQFSILGRTAEDRVWINTTGVVGDGVQAPAGSAYLAALYWGPAGATTDAGFVQAGAPLSFPATGQFGGGQRTISPLAVNGDTVSVQVRGWSTAGGAQTYEQALALGTEAGKSPWFDLKTKDPTDTLPSPSLGLQPEWNGMSITPVPEPSVIALGVAGVLALLFRQRYWR